MPETDFLDEIKVIPIPADKGLRFLNWLIDVILFYIVFLGLVFIVAIIAPDSARIFTSEDAGSKIIVYAISFSAFFLFFFLIEGLSKGRTLGKLITRTKAVKEDGSNITFSDAAKGSLTRIVPFEPFSAFGGRPWHDKWRATVVIKK